MHLTVIKAAIPDVLIIEPQVFRDSRGFFMETFHGEKYRQIGIKRIFVQDNHSHSQRGILRGLHYQLKQPQAKLVYAVRGEIFDVAVDIRRGSPTFARWAGAILSAENNRQFYIPEGFAHGFYVLSERADVIYKCSDYYAPDDEYGLLYSDPAINIDWPLEGEPLLSVKDCHYPLLKNVPETQLPMYPTKGL